MENKIILNTLEIMISYCIYFFVIFKFLVITMFCILKEKQNICKKFLMSQGPGGNGATRLMERPLVLRLILRDDQRTWGPDHTF